MIRNRRYIFGRAAHVWTTAVALVVGAGLLGPGLGAQQRAADNGALETVQVKPNLYVIFGAGANITVHLGEDGIILVDSGTEGASARVLEALKRITNKRLRLIINTSADADHVGGNTAIGKTGFEVNPDAFAEETHATIIAHENVLNRLSAPGSKVPSTSWPTETFTSRVRSLYLNDDAVVILRQLGAHSDGDSMVQFRKLDVLVVGDVMDLRQFPVIDPAQGGSIQGELDALNRLLELTVPAMPLVHKPGRTLIVPGHGRVSDYAELVEYRDMVTIIKDNIQELINQGMTLAQVKAANPTAGFRGRYGSDSGPWTTDMFVEAVYNGLKAKAPGKS